MSNTIHIVTKHFPPIHGGLESWTWTLARMLSDNGHLPVVHIRSAACLETERMAYEAGAALEQLAPAREALIAPLLDGTVPERILQKEHARVDSLTIRRRIRAWMLKRPGRHVVISNFALFEGFLASAVAIELNLPHIAVLAGTDFSRGIRDPLDFSTLQHVVREAKFVVTKSHEQERYLRAAFKVLHVRTIETSVENIVSNTQWTNEKSQDLSIFSDSGFSNKKGTQILINAFRTLRANGFPASLAICGDLAEGQEKYWRHLIDAAQTEYPNHFEYLGYISHEAALERLQCSAIYASATLGEGCSKARATAVCVGIPTVTTRCGEWANEGIYKGVFLAEAGDPEGFYAQLKSACEQTIERTIRSPNVSLFRERFSRERESTAWKNLMDSLND